MTMITNCRCLLFFIGVTKAKKKKHKANDFVLSFSSLRGARGGGSKVDDDLCDRRRFLFFIKVTIEKK